MLMRTLVYFVRTTRVEGAAAKTTTDVPDEPRVTGFGEATDDVEART